MGRSRRIGEHTRRVFLHRLSFMGGGVVLLGAGCKDRKSASAPKVPGRRAPLTTSHLTFTDDEHRVMSAACERILPKDTDVGAVEAGVPTYIDRMLQSPQLVQMREDFVNGLAALDRRSKRRFQVSFDAATPAQQDELLTAFKDSPLRSGEARFYELLLVLTLEGFFGDPSYGGNKDRAGWALIGYSVVGSHAAPPPPGYDGTSTLHHHKGH